MDLQLDGRTIIVTGASAGIGKAVCDTLREEGATAIGVARNTPDGSDGSSFIAADLADPSEPLRVVNTVVDQFGRIDGLVNNVGAMTSRAGFLDVSDEAWNATWNLNVMAGVRITRAAMPALLKADGASVVHVTSEAARLGDPTMVDYAVSKTALLTISKALAAEFSPHGVRSNIVAPGPTRTRLWDEPGGFADQLSEKFDLPVEEAVDHFVSTVRQLPSRQLGTPAQVARVIAILLSPITSQVTGSEWAIDGGALRQI